MIKKFIQQQEREFDEKFVKKATNWRENHGWTVDYVDSRADNIKSLILSQKIELLEKVVEMIENVPVEEIEIPEHECHLYCCGTCSCEEKDGMIKRSQILSTLQETIKEIK